MALAKACLATGRQGEAETILKNVLQNRPDSAATHARVTEIMAAHGEADRAERLIGDSRREVVELNNEAVRKGMAGDYATAGQMLTEAAERLPGNLQIVANAAYALLLDVFANGVDENKLREAQRYRQAVEARDGNHPKLAEIADVLARIRLKYKLAGG
jgi:Flp pilus assembly protein TadD